MSSMKGKMLRALSGLLKSVRVTHVEDVGSGFRRIVLAGDALPSPEPGAKVQLLLPSDDVRTYSPIAAPDGMALLGYRNAPGPGGAWVGSVRVGDQLHLAGPQRSLVLPPGPIILVGDETSIAVAASFEVASAGRVVQAVFEAGDVEASRLAAEAVGLRTVHLAGRGDYSGMVEAIAAAHARASEAVIALTGGAELVLGVRTLLRSRGLTDIKTKTYWIPGRAGLD